MSHSPQLSALKTKSSSRLALETAPNVHIADQAPSRSRRLLERVGCLSSVVVSVGLRNTLSYRASGETIYRGLFVPARGLRQGQQSFKRLHQQVEDKAAFEPRPAPHIVACNAGSHPDRTSR